MMYKNNILRLITVLLLCGLCELSAASEKGSPKKEGATPVLTPAQNGSLRNGAIRLPLSNRWGMVNAYGANLPRHSIFDPYNPNILKGDFPVLGLNTFMVLTGLYNPKTLFNSQQNVGTQFNNDLTASLEFFHGATVFKPKDWSVKGTGKGFFNRGNNENEDFGLLELFGELKLFDVGSNFDFVSTRAGVQFFKTDFNGLIFQDFNLGALLFGELNANRNQWSTAYVDFRKKRNGLITFDAQNQQLWFANWFQEDFLRPGFNTVFSFHYNRDRQIQNDLDVFYAGVAAAGHWGRIVFNPAFYYAFGQEQVAGSSRRISAFLTGVELAYPRNFFNYRAAVFYASGDANPADSLQTGFDSVNDNVQLFGAANSFVVGGGQFGTRANSFLPSFRPLATRANFVNPGILLLNTGLDVVLTPKLFLETNVNYFRFANLASIAGLTDSESLGFEVVTALNYRLFLNENFVVQAGASGFFPGAGGRAILGQNDNLILTANLALVALF